MKQYALRLALLALGACSSDGGVTIMMTASGDAPAYGQTPFPTDAVRDGDRLGTIAGLEALVGRHADLIGTHVAALDGFGVRPLVEFFVDGPIDQTSVPGRTTELADVAGLVDVDPASPERGRVIPMEWRYDQVRSVIAGVPASGEVLRDGTRYAAFATTAIRGAEGGAVRRAGDLSSGLASDERWRTTAEALAELGELGELDGGDRIAGLTVFTTQRATAALVAARDAFAGAPAPTLTFDPALVFRTRPKLNAVFGTAARATDGPRAGLERWGSDNPTGMAHEHVGVLATGTTTSLRFRRDDTGTDLTDDETFDLADGAPRVVAVEPIPVTFILPDTQPPPDGYPVVIYGHGLGAGRDQLLAFAEPLTSQGYALVGIDMADHGSRYQDVDAGSNLAAGKSGFTGDRTLRDGFGDVTGLATTFDFFEGFLNVAAVRDSIRQSALDLSRLVQLLKQPGLDLSALGAGTKLDTRRIAYLGESFGTVVGTLFAAIEPDVDLYVLNVPGGGILDLLLPTSAEIGSLALPIISTIYNPTAPLDRWSPLIGLMQAVLDGADPLTYAPHVLRDRFTIGGRQLGPRSVIAIEVVGDQVLSNRGTDALAQALRLDVLEPHLELPAGLRSIPAPAAGNRDGQTAVLVQYAPATHGANWSAERGTLRYLPEFPHAGDTPFPLLPATITIPNPIYETHAQVAEILATHRTGAAPSVSSTKPPMADFDADGAADVDDLAPYDPAVR
jgi:dienelactone hydrolase